MPQPRSRSQRARFPLAGCLVALASFGAAACSEGPFPDDHHLSSVSFPLFDNYEEECRELLVERERAGAPITELTEQVRWESTLAAAFERATLEDKPVMIATFVRENGDPHCDV